MDPANMDVNRLRTKNLGIPHSSLLVSKMLAMQGRSITPFLLKMDEKELKVLQAEENYFIEHLPEKKEQYQLCGVFPLLTTIIGIATVVGASAFGSRNYRQDLNEGAAFTAFIGGVFIFANFVCLVARCISIVDSNSTPWPNEEILDQIKMSRANRLNTKMRAIERRVLEIKEKEQPESNEEIEQLEEVQDFFKITRMNWEHKLTPKIKPTILINNNN